MLQLGQRLQRARLLMVLCCAVLVICQAGPVTHRCNLHVDGAQKTLNLSCQYQQQGASSKCKLVVYYNSTVPSLRSLKPFGIPTYALPKLPSAPLRSAEMNATEMKLNRTEPIYNSIMWPLLYFHGGPSCHVRFESPVIREVELPKQSGEGSQVLVFGGGLTATLIGGEITKNTADMGVTVLAGSTLRASHTRCTLNNLSRGCFYGSYTSQLSLDHVTLSSNTANEGAGLYLVNSRASVTNSNLSHNVATAGGGAAYVKGGSSIYLTKCHLLGNAAPTGGALTVYDAPLVHIHSCDFERNYAHSDDVDLSTDNYYQLGVGGALYLEYSVVDVISSTLEGNKAVMDGGAMRLQAAQLTISHSSITNNLAYRHGGGIYAGAVDTDGSRNSTLRIVHCALRDNTAQANGGGIMINRWCHTTIINSSFKGCKAWSEGDGVCTILGGQDTAHLQDDLRTQLTINNVQFLADEETDEKLFVGPFFNLTFENTDLNQRSVGVVWRRRLCHKGEYVALSGYCEECPSYTFSTEEKFPGHTSGECQAAPRIAFAPGGAVLVPFPGGWHGVHGSVHVCSGCPPFVAKLEEIKRCICRSIGRGGRGGGGRVGRSEGTICGWCLG